MSDDGFNIGVLYTGQRTPYPTSATSARKPGCDPASLEAEFEL